MWEVKIYGVLKYYFIEIFMLDFILEVMDKKKVIVLVFFDLLKVFDSFEYSIFVWNFWGLGFFKGVIKWFKSYLIDRF